MLLINRRTFEQIIIIKRTEGGDGRKLPKEYIMKRITLALTALLLAFCAVLSPALGRGALAAGQTCEAYLPEGCEVGSRFLEALFGKKSDAKKDSTGDGIMPAALIAGGDVFGIRIKENCITVVDSRECDDIKEGDKIISLGGVEVKTISDVKGALASLDGGDITLKVKRCDQIKTVTIKPEVVGDEVRLGVSVRDGAAGIGTVTYYDVERGVFGGLGHGICDPDTSLPIEISEGVVCGVILGGVQKGAEGKPGELCGVLTSDTYGTLYANTELGVFGELSPKENGTNPEYPIATRDEVKEGEATIISTVKNGKKAEYSVKIFDVNESSTGTKSFKIKVTDPALIALTGGIVRGMSGSPIIQNGKLVGAVTHVLVANPTEGYGIFIENMLDASQEARNELPKAA